MANIEQLIEDARGYASETADSANAALANAISAINDAPTFRPTSYNYNPGSVRLSEIGEFGDFNAVYTNPLALPASPTYLSFAPTDVVIPAAPVIDYTFNDISRPVFDVAAFDDVAPELIDVELPPDPDIIIKAAPAITEIDLGDLDDVTAPAFNAEFNETAPAFDDDLKTEFTGEYERALPVVQNFVNNQMQSWMTQYAPEYDSNRQQLMAKIAEDMEDGTAVTDEFEQALYNRARARVEAERSRTEQDLERGHGKRGFQLPPGSLTAGRNKLHQAAADQIAQQATEIAIERERIELQHKQFIMQLSSTLHQHVQGMAMQYAGVLLGINQQALDSAKEVARVVAQTYQLLLDRYKEIANVYAIESSTYKVRLEAALANVEVYKARADAARVAAQVDATKLDAYAKELDFELAKIEVYKSQLQGINTKVEINKLQLDAYATKARAYVAQVNGKESEFRAYAAALSGEETKLRAESLKVDVYNAELKGAMAQVDVDKTKADIINARNAAEAEVHKANVSAYNAAADAEAARLTSSANVFRARADAYRSRADVKIANSRIILSEEELKLRAVTADWQVSSNENIAAGKIAVERATSIARVGVAAGSTYASMAGAAMSSQNTMISETKQGS